MIEFVDNLIRSSLVGRCLPALRGSHPALYKRLRSCYERALSHRETGGLARYQTRALRHFLQFAPRGALRGMALEIGSDLEAKVIRELKHLGCEAVIGINPEFQEAELARFNSDLPEGCTLRKADLRTTCLPDDSVGVIFSVSVLEHLQEFERCLSEMHRLLAPGGFVYAEFGPIWSSSLGHHVYAIAGGEEARHWDPVRNPVPNHGHLLLDREDLQRQVSARTSHALAAEVVRWICDGAGINRLFFEDYVRLLEASAFEIVRLETDREHVPAKTLRALRERHPVYRVFNVRNVRLVLRKHGAYATTRGK